MERMDTLSLEKVIRACIDGGNADKFCEALRVYSRRKNGKMTFEQIKFSIRAKYPERKFSNKLIRAKMLDCVSALNFSIVGKKEADDSTLISLVA